MLCLRPETKDDYRRKWDNSVVPFSDLDRYGDEPSSPRVGCMGQIKHDNRVVGFPIHQRCNNHNSNGDKKKCLRLNKVFSCKNLSSSSISNYSNSKRQMMKGDSRKKFYDERDYVSNSVINLDPPLPVVIRVSPRVSTDGSDAISLWKRRCGGEDLKALQLQHRNPSCVLGPNTL
ncbi:uncharacterized protein LOC122089082 [Macadamia integrifolia]|uniref:uncharacterized protein LOC122089082 n=1 Tax=Macadamia integrifolia TaxID=60698 RepID=UPI001C4FE69B|nr:uncharacterized protein LOC122089082 [Macadamia integrifolia]